jgi:hypothetical protein
MHKVLLDGYVNVMQGDNVIIHQAHNKMVDAGVLGILSFIAMDSIAAYSNGPVSAFPSYDWTIRLGSNTATKTNNIMTALVEPIGIGLGTIPTSKNIVYSDRLLSGFYGITYSGTWDPASINGFIGEIGLWLTVPKQTNWRWSIVNHMPGLSMVSRLSVADGELNVFQIDPIEPLTVNWSLLFSFE